VPNLNIHISESVLTNGSLPPSASNRCTESKMVNKSLHEEKERPTLKTNQKW
jgi:hypothetical protein